MGRKVFSRRLYKGSPSTRRPPRENFSSAFLDDIWFLLLFLCLLGTRCSVKFFSIKYRLLRLAESWDREKVRWKIFNFPLVGGEKKEKSFARCTCFGARSSSIIWAMIAWCTTSVDRDVQFQFPLSLACIFHLCKHRNGEKLRARTDGTITIICRETLQFFVCT